MPAADKEPLLRGGDAYASLLRETRGLSAENAQAREAWLHRLPLEGKSDVLFELEVLLKGLACFANPRNHPGPPKRGAVVSQDFREPTHLAREALARIVILCRALLPERSRALVFQRYLETVLPEEGARARITRESRAQATPEGSLTVLRHGMTSFVELATGIVRLPRVPYRLFYALLRSAQREVLSSAHFNPLTALEFRPELDRITNTRILELMRAAPGEEGRRLVALTFLSLFRMLRYIALAEACVRSEGDARPRAPGLVYLVLSVLRSDAYALTGHLRNRAGALLADGFERDLFKVPARELAARHDALRAEGQRLIELKATLEGVSGNIRLELRRAFEHDFPSPDLAPTPETLRAATTLLTATLRPAIQSAILVVGKALGSRLDEHGVFDDLAARRSLSERLRRDVWMFAQIVRAFGQKALAVRGRGDDRWGGASSFEFVREFLSYFRAMGYPLLRAADYPRFDAYLSAMSALEEVDLLDQHSGLSQAVAESEQFFEFLSTLFDQIGHRVELAEIPFNRREAAGSLKLYLGD